jgi:hypothetical protein
VGVEGIRQASVCVRPGRISVTAGICDRHSRAYSYVTFMIDHCPREENIRIIGPYGIGPVGSTECFMNAEAVIAGGTRITRMYFGGMAKTVTNQKVIVDFAGQNMRRWRLGSKFGSPGGQC